jgi:protein-tyrosine phosphatase
VNVLFVCHGNICRSPVAERLATLWAREALGFEPEKVGIRIGSAGLGAREGEPVDPMSAEALRELGGSPEGFRSRSFVPTFGDDSGLVLTMTERQRRSVLAAMPLGLRRTFTLPEAAALLPLADVVDLPSMAPGQRLAELGRRLDAARARRPAPRWQDISDPLGRRPSVHRETAQRIGTALRPLVDVIFREPPPRQEAPARALRDGASPRPARD